MRIFVHDGFEPLARSPVIVAAFSAPAGPGGGHEERVAVGGVENHLVTDVDRQSLTDLEMSNEAR